jgi:hypothetical protein
MKISVRRIEPRDQIGKFFVQVSFWNENGQSHNGAEVEVFVDQHDSYSEIRKRALERTREFLQEVLACEDVEDSNLLIGT